MTPITLSALALVGLLVATGFITSLSDIKERKIKNKTLLLLGLAAILLHLWTAWNLKTVPWLSIASTLAAALAGFLLFINQMWRPGDAKLFILYSLLMPPTGYEYVFPLPSLILFINTFLAGLLFLVPVTIRALILERDNILKKFFCQKSLGNLVYTFFLTTVLSWTIFPLLSLIKIPHNNPFALCLVFILYKKMYSFRPSAPLFKMIIVGLALTGLILQAFFTPELLTLTNISRFLLRMIPLAIAAQALNDITATIKDAKDRIPFAPFLLIGFLLSYTPFLPWIMRMLKF